MIFVSTKKFSTEELDRRGAYGMTYLYRPKISNFLQTKKNYNIQEGTLSTIDSQNKVHRILGSFHPLF